MIDKKRDGNLNKVLLADVVKEIVPSNESSNNNYRKASQAEFDANNELPLNNSGGHYLSTHLILLRNLILVYQELKILDK